MKTKNGISLIVLVITIVVMIILATVIILSLSGSGIIDNAKEARDKSDNANLKDAAIVAYSEWTTAKALGKTELNGRELTEKPKDYIDEVLEDAGFTELERDKVEIENGKIATDYIAFYIKDDEETVKYKVKEGTTWEEFVSANAEDELQGKSGFYISKINNSDLLIISYTEYAKNSVGGDTILLRYILKENTMDVYNLSYEEVKAYALENDNLFFKTDEKIQNNVTYFLCLNSLVG